MERTFAMVKPDGISKGIMGEVIKRYEQKGLKITAMKLVKAGMETVEKHYEQHKGKSFYDSLIDFITSGPVLAMVIEGENAIEAVRRINGPTKQEDAVPGSIRGDFAESTRRNVVHGSDSPEAAEREIAIWFD